MSAEPRTVTSHTTVRLEIPIQQEYDDFRQRFERAVPTWDRERAVELVERKAPWSEVVAQVAALAPNDFLLYWKLDLSPLMSLAGNQRRATEYLMGNHVLAETMYRHDPVVALYIPLRCVLYEADEGVRFAIEQPGTILSGLGRGEITQAGLDLDRKLAKLLAILTVEVPQALIESHAPA